MKKKPFNFQSGQAALLAVIMFLFISLVVTSSFALLGVRHLQAAGNLITSKKSYAAAESALEDFAYRFKKGQSPSGLTYTDPNGATVTVGVAGTITKQITVTSNLKGVYRAMKGNLITSIKGSFKYGAQVGPLGLGMTGFAQVNGSVFSAGSITGAPNTVIFGDAYTSKGISSTADAEQNAQTAVLNLRDSSTHKVLAQSFVAVSTAQPLKFGLYVKKFNNPGSDLRVRIMNNNTTSCTPPVTSCPDIGSQAIANKTISNNDIGTSFGWVEKVFGTVNTNLTSGQKYWLVVEMISGPSDYSKYYILGSAADSSYGGTSHTALYQPAPSNDNWWVAPIPAANDIAFRVYLGSWNTTIDSMKVKGNAHSYSITNSVVGTYTDINNAATYSGTAKYFSNVSGTTVQKYNVGYAACFGNPNCTELLPNPSPEDPPISDVEVEAFIDDANRGPTCGPSDGCVAGSLTIDNVTKTINGPFVISGDLKIKNNGKLILGVDGTLGKGPVLVRGRGIFSNKCQIALAKEYGDTNAAIVFDNTTNITQSIVDINDTCAFYGSGNGINASGGPLPGQPLLDPSGDPPHSFLMILAKSPNVRPSRPPAIQLNNQASGGIIYAVNGQVELNNNVGANTIYGQRVTIENSASLTYKEGLSNLSFSVGPEGGWGVSSWGETQ